MRNWAVVAVVVGLTYFLFFRSPGTQDVLSKLGPVAGGGIEILKDAGGADFDVHSLVEPGHITVVEFYNDACVGRRRLRDYFRRFLPLRPDVAVKMVRMPNDWNKRWAERQFHLNVQFTSFIQIYDANGNLVAADNGDNADANKVFIDMMNKELRRDWEKKHQRA